MAEELIIRDGAAFFYGDDNGDVEATGPTGYFFEDVRHLSTWCLLVDGEPVEPLTSTKVDYFSARIVGMPRGTDRELSVRRDRFITDGFHEDIVVTNLRDEARNARVELRFASDFADVMEARERGLNEEGRMKVELGSRTVRFDHHRNGHVRGTVITFNKRPRLTKSAAVFAVELGPHDEWSLCVDVVPVVEGKRRPALLRCESFGRDVPKMELDVEQWLDLAPSLETDSLGLAEVYRTSLVDLASPRLRPIDGLKWALPGGGLPWFMTLFGRDSLIASYQALPFQPRLAETTLVALADLQAPEFDHYRDAEPGKIAHELRRGILSRLGLVPHSPYYGTHDATLWFLVVLDEYERWTGDTALVRRLEANARAAIGWMEGPADLDGDGWLEYKRRSDGRGALDNQGWKDSDDAVLFADGRRAEPPIALCEVQGYAYDGRLRSARLAREVWGDEAFAQRLEERAADVRERFHDAFWVRGRRHYALALDKDKAQVDSLTSNTGHLLFSGLLDEARARQTARRLLRPDMFSGWGIRSLSADDAGYNPLGYHIGTVWPHDTALIAEGMRGCRLRDEASRLVVALLAAAERFEHQLPEVFAGFARDAADVPVAYPGALRPQAWAAGAPLMALRTLLGLDVVDGRLEADPHSAEGVPRIELRRLRFRGRTVDVTG